MENLFDTFSNLKRVHGVDGHNKTDVLQTLSMRHCPPEQLPDSFDVDNLGVKKGSSTFLSRLGCTLSHLRAIFQAYDEKREYALILEDDATPDLVPTWPGSLKEYIATLPKDWTIVQLSALAYAETLTRLYTKWQTERKREHRGVLTTMAKDSGLLVWSAQAYLISRKGMERISAKYRKKDGSLDICSASCIELDDCILHEGVGMKGYRIATPPLFVPRQDMKSTIGQIDSESGKKVAEKDETRKMYEESRNVLYQWAGSWALSGYQSANLKLDTGVLRNVMDAGLKSTERLNPRSFKTLFHGFCEEPTNMCSIDENDLTNDDDPQYAAPTNGDLAVSGAISSDFFSDTLASKTQKAHKSVRYAQQDTTTLKSAPLGSPSGSYQHGHSTKLARLGEAQQASSGNDNSGKGRWCADDALCTFKAVASVAAAVGFITGTCAALIQRRRSNGAARTNLLDDKGSEVYGADTEGTVQVQVD